ncbi:MAG: TonB-dependent receptor family protein, partial [Bacteroidales bacterium]|nr:TonB-dependent receptor family protein [Bacteroidales bacterium]
YYKDLSHPEIHKNGSFYDQLTRYTYNDIDPDRQNTINMYYNGRISGLSIDFNTDVVVNNKSTNTIIDETSSDYEDRGIDSDDDINARMYATKLIFGHSLWQGNLNFGGEYVYSDYKDTYMSKAQQWIPSADSRNRQTSASAFVQYSRRLADNWKLSTGLRYEHVDMKYYEDDVLEDETSRKYDNFFPTVSLGFSPGDVEMSLSYAQKTKRPLYSQMRNSFWYVNRFSIEGGNPGLRPYFVKDLSYLLSWNFMQVELSYKLYDDYIIGWYYIDNDKPDVLVSSPINLADRMPALDLNISLSPEIGVWYPLLDFTLSKQWLKLESCGVTKKQNDLRITGTFDNSVYFDNGLMLELLTCFFTKGHEKSRYYANNYCTFDFSATYTFFGCLGVSMGVADIFDTNKETIKYLSPFGYEDFDDKFETRSFYLQIHYIFNPAKSKYKGTGAGIEEKERF